MHKVLILGGSGLVGSAILNEMSNNKEFEIYATYCKNPLKVNNCTGINFDINDLEGISKILSSLNPDIIISCLRGDFNKQLAVHIKVAEYLNKSGRRLYFFSTTNVFDNDFKRPHKEDDLPNSQTDYGQYKMECEKKIIGILHHKACILRIPQVWGKNSPRIINILNSLKNNEDIIVYPKLFLNTNTDVMIAKQLCYIIDNNLEGNFHLVAEDVVNYKDFYCELIKSLGFNKANIKENFEEEGYFALLSKRNNEFPKQLRFTNKWVIDYLHGAQI